MPRSRLVHKLALLADRDALHSLAVAGLACVASLGVVYVGYFVHVVRIARSAPCEPGRGQTVLLFGKHAPRGRPDPDFQARLQRAATLWRQRPPRSMLLLGGGPAGAPTEAALAQAHLRELGIPTDAPLVLEDRSRDTLQNLRNARALWQPDAATDTVTLLSSRYHLARCWPASWACAGNCARPNRHSRGGRRRCGAWPARRPTCAGPTWARAGRA